MNPGVSSSIAAGEGDEFLRGEHVLFDLFFEQDQIFLKTPQSEQHAHQSREGGQRQGEKVTPEPVPQVDYEKDLGQGQQRVQQGQDKQLCDEGPV